MPRLCLVLLVVFFHQGFAQMGASDDKLAVPGTFIILSNADFTGELNPAVGRIESERLDPHLPLWKLEYEGDWADPAVLDWLYAQEQIEIAQHDHYLEWRETIPNDSSFNRQWHLKNTGQIGGLAGTDIDATFAWDSTTGGTTSLGDSIVLAIIDSKVDLDHPDLNFFVNRFEIPNNGMDDDSNGYVDDYYGFNTLNDAGNLIDIQTQQVFISHGTHVSGIAAARGNNNRGVSGVNWDAQVLAIVTDLSIVESEVVEAYAYAIAMKQRYLETNGAEGAFVVASNSSFGVNNGDPANYPIWCAMYDSMGDAGILSAGATANSTVDVGAVGDMPSLCPSDHLIMVTNSDNRDIPVSSGYSESFVDLSAPGTAIYSTLPGNAYGNRTGTSMACPMVTGSIGLIYSQLCPEAIQASYQHPDSIALIVKDMILQSIDKVEAYRGITVTEGRLNIGRAMELSRNFNCNNCDYNLSSDFTDPNCAGEASGTITIGTDMPPLDFSWSNGDTTSSVSNLEEGKNSVRVSDSACSTNLAFFINDPASLEISTLNLTGDDGTGNGSIQFQVTGGKGLKEYRLDNGSWQILGVFNNLSIGTYDLQARDSLGCTLDTLVQIVSVGIPSPIDLGIRVFPNPSQGQLFIQSSSNEIAAIEIFDLSGAMIFREQLGAVSQRVLNMSNFSAGMYILKIEDASGMKSATSIIKQ